MIGKLMRNDSFQETTRYVLGKKEARILTGGTIAENAIAGIAQEFLMSRDLKPNTKQPVYHLVQSYSYSDRDTQTLDDDRLSDLALRHFAGLVVSAREPKLLKEQGRKTYRERVEAFLEEDIFEYQFFIAKHEDTDHTHTHLVASRINLHNGKTIHTYKDYYRNQIVCRELEKDFGLEQIPSMGEIDRRHPSRQQQEKEKTTGIAPILTKLQDTISDIAKTQRGANFNQFAAALAQAGIETKRIDRTIQKANQEPEIQIGLSYAMEGVAIPSCRLGKSFTYSGLQKQFEIDKLELEPSRLSIPGSTEREIAQFILTHAHDRLRQNKRTSAKNDRYWAKQEADGELRIGRLGETEPIAQGKLTPQGWEISIAQATLDDQQAFLARQQAEQQLAERERARKDRARSNSRGFELE